MDRLSSQRRDNGGSEGAQDEALHSPSWQALSVDILANVYSRLPGRLDKQAFAQVSKEWAEVAHKSTSRRQIRSGEVVSVLVKNVSHPLTDIDCSKATLISDQQVSDLVQHCGPSLLSLNLSRARLLGPIGLEAVARHCTALKTLDLSGSLVVDAALEKLAACSSLEALHLKRCRQLTHKGIEDVVPRLRTLREVNLSSCRVTDEAVRKLVQGCPHLTSLDLSHTGVGNRAMNHVAAALRLESLSLRSTNLWDSGLMELAQGCPALKKVYLSVTKLGDESVMAFARSHPDLQEMDVSHTRVSPAIVPFLRTCEFWGMAGAGVPDRVFDFVLPDPGGPPPLPLKKLTLTCVAHSEPGAAPGEQHPALLALLPWLPQLHTLELDGWGTPNALFVALGLHCSELRELSVREVAAHEPTNGPGPEVPQGMASLAAGCPKLQRLEMRNCHLKTEELVNIGRFRDLRILKAVTVGHPDSNGNDSENDDERDDVVNALAGGCKNLTHLELRGYTVEGIKRVAAGCPKLQELKICPDGTVDWDGALKALGESAKELRVLCVQRMGVVSEAGLRGLLENAPQLEELEVSCALDDAALAFLAQMCPLIRVVKQRSSKDTPSCTDDGLLHFLKEAKCLVVLGIQGCEGLTAAGLRRLLDFRGLEEIRISSIMQHKVPVRELTSQHCYVSGDGFEPYDMYSGTSETEDSRFEDLLRRIEAYDGDA